MPGLALIFAVCLALIHLGASRFSLATAEPRSRWLSLAGGASVAYVFVHILPELKKGQDVMVRADLPLEFLEHHAYIVALLGFVTFYGLERLAVRSRRQSLAVKGRRRHHPHGFLDPHPLLRLLQRPGGLSAPAPGATGNGEPQLLFRRHGGAFPGE